MICKAPLPLGAIDDRATALVASTPPTAVSPLTLTTLEIALLQTREAGPGGRCMRRLQPTKACPTCATDLRAFLPACSHCPATLRELQRSQQAVEALEAAAKQVGASQGEQRVAHRFVVPYVGMKSCSVPMSGLAH